jgi:hypothetical protein
VSGPAAVDEDFLALANDELAQALRLRWRDLAAIVPWGDRCEAISPAGRDALVERGYLWEAAEGGPILCEVVVHAGESRFDKGVRVSAVIPPDRR